MADFNMLETVKSALNITGTYQDDALNAYINEVNEYLLAAGVDKSLINVQTSAGTVTRGVADLWNYGAGDGKLSPYFYERVIQLATPDSASTSCGCEAVTNDQIDDITG